MRSATIPNHCRLLVLAAVAVTMPVVPNTAAAQDGRTLEGVVVDARTRRPLRHVELRILDTELMSDTGGDGAFRFPDLPSGTVIVTASLHGYVTFTDRLVVPEGRTYRLEIRMETLRAILDGLRVITARPPRPPSDASRATLQGGTPLEDRAELLAFRPSGVGGGTDFLIRGVKTLTGRTGPAVFVDGVRVRDRDAIGPDAFGPGILDLIPPESIDSIRVLRGASTAALHGAPTANGVILIYTRQGRKPKP